jgi:hypothetical protein
VTSSRPSPCRIISGVKGEIVVCPLSKAGRTLTFRRCTSSALDNVFIDPPLAEEKNPEGGA